MKLKSGLVILAAVMSLTLNLEAATRFVDLNNPTPVSPYTNWADAATNIQAAIDVATNSDLILVTNGVYQTGGRVASGAALTNRVAVTKAVTVQSVNGPGVTIIQGSQVAGTTNGVAAVRCVYLTNGAILSGFTLTNGATRSAGFAADMKGGGLWCVSTNAAVSNCVMIGNAAFSGGGGTYQGTLTDCTLTWNSVSNGYGGGALMGMLRNCTLMWNQAKFGGGAASNVLTGCVLASNAAATDGGGAYRAALNNCTLTGNSANDNGGGANSGALSNCRVTGNSAYSGGGTYSGTHTNCTLTGNSALTGGGAYTSTFYNSIIYFNTAASGPNYSASTFNFCCTLPSPGGSNLALDPQLASASHLSASSPCRGAGSTNYSSGVDMDGETWLSPPAIGCDEFKPGALTGALSVNVRASFTNVAAGFPLALIADIEGRTSASVWDFGDGTTVSNQPYTSHVWSSPGDYALVLSAFNESQPGGMNATRVIHVLPQPVYYVDASNSSPAIPYDSWNTAATNIQDAVDAATAAGALVLVTNGVYQNGGRAAYGNMTNRVMVDKPLILESVNGPQFTIIQGKQAVGTFKTGPDAIRCMYLAGGTRLSGFTLTKGATHQTVTFSNDRNESGGGLWCGSAEVVITNCTLAANAAFVRGGGAFFGVLTDCVLADNSAAQGGGAFQSTLNRCTVIHNAAEGEGGGVSEATLTNCVVARNTGNLGGGAYSSTLTLCSVWTNSSSLHGGGTFSGTISQCTLAGNSAASGGGGAENGTLMNCTLTANTANGGGGADSAALYNCLVTGNSAGLGGGTLSSGLNNCTVTGNSATSQGGGMYYGAASFSIVYFNSAPGDANYYFTTPPGGGLYNSCTTPLPTVGQNNITNEPLFVDFAGGDFHLQPASPCINATAYVVSTTTDLDGNPRTVGGTTDMGAYEFQTPSSVLSYAWALQFGLPVDGSADYADADGDGANNWQEWQATTVPIDATSVFTILTVSKFVSGVGMTWQSVPGKTYRIQRSTNLLAQPFVTIKSNIVAPTNTASYTDITATNSGPYFYRVGLQ